VRGDGVIRENFREYLEHLLRDGFSVRHDAHLSDPDLIDPGGDPVETWREDYPYDERSIATSTKRRSTSYRSSC
jgi:polyphosphate kinase